MEIQYKLYGAMRSAGVENCAAGIAPGGTPFVRIGNDASIKQMADAIAAIRQLDEVEDVQPSGGFYGAILGAGQPNGGHFELIVFI